ncbi:MAG: hypothetical protein IPI78_12330 [Chitinophagaceae bacterium]|nr:hypothetical protein [Chitinophagaceae bacterium]
MQQHRYYQSLSTGINYSDLWANKIKVNGSYFFLTQNQNKEENSLRRTTYNLATGDSIAIRNNETYSNNLSQNHRFNLRMEYQIDSMDSLIYIPSFNHQRSENFSSDTTFVMADDAFGKTLLLQVNQRTQIVEMDLLFQIILFSGTSSVKQAVRLH